jgi:hypothetical protein
VGGRRGGWAAGLVRWAGKRVGPAGKKRRRKECWLVGWVKEREGGRDRDRGEKLEGGIQTLEILNFYLKTKALKQKNKCNGMHAFKHLVNSNLFNFFLVFKSQFYLIQLFKSLENKKSNHVSIILM